MGVRGYRDIVKQPEKKEWLGVPLCLDYALDKPLHWKKPRKISVCSMSDLFHPKVPDKFIGDVFEIIRKTQQHTYQILTKRTERMADLANELLSAEVTSPKRLEHVWWGGSISTQEDADKNIPILLQIPAAVRFVSLEPMLERIKFGAVFLRDIDWVIIGCESGPKARLCSIEDIQDAVRQCKDAGVAVFVKQVPINDKCSKDPKEWPEDLRVQDYPAIVNRK